MNEAQKAQLHEALTSKQRLELAAEILFDLVRELGLPCLTVEVTGDQAKGSLKEPDVVVIQAGAFVGSAGLYARSEPGAERALAPAKAVAEFEARLGERILEQSRLRPLT